MPVSYTHLDVYKRQSQYIYDFKYPDLSTIAYNHLLNHPDGYKVKPKFYVINFDDPRRSHRCLSLIHICPVCVRRSSPAAP